MNLRDFIKKRAFLLKVTAISLVVLTVHISSRNTDSHNDDSHHEFTQLMTPLGLYEIGEDGYYIRAVKNGYDIFRNTPRYAGRFTTKSASDKVNSCSDCHTLKQLSYAWVTSDRYVEKYNRRLMFEEKVMRCYVAEDRMNGYAPSFFDPAIQNIKILSRFMAQGLGLSEGDIE